MLFGVIDAYEQVASAPRLPAVTELCAAMVGSAPEPYPARTVLLGAFMLTSVCVTGSTPMRWRSAARTTPATAVTLRRFGSADQARYRRYLCPVRALLIDRINDAAGGCIRTVSGTRSM